MLFKTMADRDAFMKVLRDGMCPRPGCWLKLAMQQDIDGWKFEGDAHMVDCAQILAAEIMLKAGKKYPVEQIVEVPFFGFCMGATMSTWNKEPRPNPTQLVAELVRFLLKKEPEEFHVNAAAIEIGDNAAFGALAQAINNKMIEDLAIRDGTTILRTGIDIALKHGVVVSVPVMNEMWEAMKAADQA
jgi:hypothetical protein